jgi:hypothetical protein
LLSGGVPRRRWQAVFGRPPPEHLTADLLWRMIAARIQEEAFGTLDRATLKLQARSSFNFESHHALGRLTTPTKLQVSTSQSCNPNGLAFL